MRVLVILFLLLAQGLLAQEPLCLVKRYGVEDGLLNRRVTGIAQDREGFLWIGTPGGLHRFDGYAFKTYTTTDGLSSNIVDAIWTDADGLLWLVRGGTRSDLEAVSIDIMDPHTGQVQTFEDHFGPKAPLRASDLLPACDVEQDSTLVLSAPGRLVRYHPRTGFTIIPTVDELEFLPAVTMLSGATWGSGSAPATGRNTVMRVEGANVHTDTLMAGTNIFWSVVGNASMSGGTFEKNGRYLSLVRTDGLAEEWWLSPKGEPKLIRSGPKPGDRPSLIRMPLGNDLWLVDATVRRMKPGDDPLAAPVLFDLSDKTPEIEFRMFTTFRDQTGHIWIGGDFGLYRLEVRPNPFQRLLWSPDIPRGHGIRIRGMAVLDSTLFVNSELEGHWRLNTRTGAVVEEDTSAVFRFALVPDGHGGLWSAEGDSLIHRTTTGTRAGRGMDIKENFVWSVLPMTDDALLLGSATGIGWADRITPRFTAMNSGEGAALKGVTVVDLTRDRGGEIWASTSVGLFNCDGTGRITARWWSGANAVGDSAHFLPASDFRHFRQDRDGIIWLATADAGLLRWDRATGEVRAVSRREGLASNSVYASYADDLGQLWLPTDNGIARYDPVSGLVNNYSTTDGITHNEFNRLAHAQGPDGRLYFGGLNGITAFDPQALRNMHPGSGAPLVLTEVRQFIAATDREEDLTTAVHGGVGITMEPDDRYFSLNMALLSFEDATRINYAWRIDDVDKDWNYQHEPSLRIAALPYGEHLLRIKAQGGNGVWSDELNVPVHFERPLYLRWWFIALCASVLIAMAYWIMRSQIARAWAYARGQREE
ncbi:MAG: two-component regulator propeller domain-containing protein [Flavobacteriales bacterium]